ncbi:MAG TPA: AMP-binding protein, partial [Rheinheimera sp.]|nr:AMP-binding protein [Rheinheimera sp.]
MTKNIHDIITLSAASFPTKAALYFKQSVLTYAELAQQVSQAAALFQRCDVKRFDRIAVYLPKQFETVFSLFGSSMAGGV